MFARFFHNSPVPLAKQFRTSDQFSFGTRYPRKSKSPSFQNSFRKNAKLSDKLRLTNVKSSKPQDSRKMSGRQFKNSPLPNMKDSRKNSEMFKLTSSQELIYNSTISDFKQSKSPLQLDVNNINSFADFPLNSHVLNAVQHLGIGKPTEIQLLSISKYFSGHERMLIAAETGSGKTLAYLLPIFNDLVTQDQKVLNEPLEPGTHAISAIAEDGTRSYEQNSLSRLRVPKCPRAIILVPSRQLVAQVTSVAKALAHNARLAVLGIHGKVSRRELKEKLYSPVDVLVTTESGLKLVMSPLNPKPVPGTITHSKKGFDLSLRNCSHLIIDEMDTMFDKDNRQFTSEIIKSITLINKQRSKTQLSTQCKVMLATATLSTFSTKHLDSLLPDYSLVASTALHTVQRNVRQYFFRIDKSSSTKQNFLLEILRRSFMSSDKRVLIFCNRNDTVRLVAEFLKEKGMNVFPLLSDHANTAYQKLWLHPFIHRAREDVSAKQVRSSKSPEYSVDIDPLKPIICVATDLASRGLDTLGVDHVVMYDSPVTPIDYLHRVGRTGRNGEAGKATSIITKKDVQLMEWIEQRVVKKQNLAS